MLGQAKGFRRFGAVDVPANGFFYAGRTNGLSIAAKKDQEFWTKNVGKFTKNRICNLFSVVDRKTRFSHHR